MGAIVLTGYMGAGKSSVAAALGHRLKISVLDTDACIAEREGVSISAIFKERGEAYFRDAETKLLKELIAGGFDGIISTGGGMPLRDENKKLLKELGHVYYLKASPAAVARRLKNDDTRPLLAGAADMSEKEKRIAGMLGQREAHYAACASTVIDTDPLSVEKIADMILADEKASS